MTKKPVVLCGDLNVAHNEIDLEKYQKQTARMQVFQMRNVLK